MKSRSVRFFGALGLLAMVFPSGLLAGPVLSFTGVTTNSTNGAWSLGWQFSTNAPINVTALGFYDAAQTDGSVGLGSCTGCGEVGIYDSTGTLLVSTLVTTSGTLIGDFYYASVPTTLLAAGQNYYIVAETGNADYTWFTTGFSVDPRITFLQDEYISSSTLAFPTSSDGYTAAQGGAWFGPNFEATAVPEPSSFLLLGAGLLGFLAFRGTRRYLVRA